MENKKNKKKGLFSLLWESMTKSGESCGPECGCHTTEEGVETDTANKDSDKIEENNL